jgi:hypothetical protein
MSCMNIMHHYEFCTTLIWFHVLVKCLEHVHCNTLRVPSMATWWKKCRGAAHCKLGITKTRPTPQLKSPCSSNNLGNIVVTKHLGMCILCYFFLCVFSPSSTSLVGLVLSFLHFPIVFSSSFCFFLFLQHHLLLPIVFSFSFVLLFPSSPGSSGSSSSFSIFFPFFLCFNFFLMCLFFPSFGFFFLSLLCLVFSFLYLLLHYLLPQSFIYFFSFGFFPFFFLFYLSSFMMPSSSYFLVFLFIAFWCKQQGHIPSIDVNG